MKKFAVLLMAVGIMVQGNAIASNEISLKYDNDTLKSTVAPFKADDVVMLPLRVVMEKLGFKVFYNDATQEVHMIKDAQYSSVKLGSSLAKINGESIMLERVPITLNGTTMVPARFVSLASQKYVGWSVEDNAVILSDTLTNDGIDWSKVVRIDPNELLKNSDFENSTPDNTDQFVWKKYGYGNIKLFDENPYFGKKCILVTDRTSNYSGVSQDVKDILNEKGPGKYSISAFIRTYEDSPSIKKSYSLILRTQGVSEEKAKYAKSSISISDEWTKITVEADLNWTGELKDGLLYFEGADKTDFCDYYIDMCSLTKAE